MGATISAPHGRATVTGKVYEKSSNTKRRKLATEHIPQNDTTRTPPSIRQNGINSFARAFDTKEHILQRQHTSQLPENGLQEYGAVNPRFQPPEGHRVLRIDVSEILNKRSLSRERMVADEDGKISSFSYCRCAIAIYHVPLLDGPDGKSQMTDSQEMVRTSLLGYVEPGGRVNLPGPFLIPFHQLYAFGTRQFGEKYTLQIWFENMGRLDLWPPMAFGECLKGQGVIARRLREGNLSKGQIQLCGRTNQLLDPENQNSPIPLRLKLKGETENTSFELSVRIRWSLPIRLQAVAFTPMSEPIIVDSNNSDFHIEYSLFSENEDMQHCLVKGWTCAICNRTLKTKDTLHFHLVTDHNISKFRICESDTLSGGYSIEIWKRGEVDLSNSCSLDTLSLGLPKEPFQLERYLDGDHSWISRRLGSLDSSASTARTRSTSSSITHSRRSSPNTSVDANNSNDSKKARKLPSSSRLGPTAKPARKPPSPAKSVPHRTFTVPKTPRPLFDSLTMRVLVPGEQLRSPSPVDNSWKYAKHADIIDDFSDVTPDEKDFIHRWDPFMMKENVTAHSAFHPALVKFLDINGDWFREKPSRTTEFMKHLMAIYAKGIIQEESLRVCSQKIRRILASAEDDKRLDKGKGKLQVAAVEEAAPKPRGKKDCVCGQPVFPSQSICCDGRTCKHRYYHRACLDEEVPRGVSWRCPECV